MPECESRRDEEPTAHARCRAALRGSMADPLLLFRWLDVVLVVLAAPFVVLADLPVLGYVVGAAAWIVNRVARGARRALRALARQRPPGGRAQPRGADRALVARWALPSSPSAWPVRGRTGSMAAILLLAAFTLYFVTSLLLRPHERNTTAPMKTSDQAPARRRRRLSRHDGRRRRDLRLHAPRQRGVPAPERVQARHLDRPAGAVRHQQGGHVPGHRRAADGRSRWSTSPAAWRPARTGCRPRSRRSSA